MADDEYLTFALPGIIVMNTLFVTVYVGMGLNTDLTRGMFDRLRSLPLARWAPLAGRITADLLKQAWSIVLLLGIGAILGFRIGTSAAEVLMAVALQRLRADRDDAGLAAGVRGRQPGDAVRRHMPRAHSRRPVAGPVLGSLLWIAVILTIFAPLSTWALKRRLS